MSKKPADEPPRTPLQPRTTVFDTRDDDEAPATPAAEPLHSLHPDDAERYQLGPEHARGGLGRVYRAHDRRLERTVAIKALAREANPRAAARFQREALVTARLQHPGIVPVYDSGRWPDGKPFYAMKLVAGRTLDEAVAAAPDFAARLALLPHVLAVAEAVAYAHSEGVVHRDLKPSNVMIGDFGETVVVDWGLARDRRVSGSGDEPREASRDDGGQYQVSHSGVTRVGAVVGTPAFMPPEQARGDAVDERADVYAIGAILYHVLAARAPFEGDTDSVLAKVVVVPPAPLEELAPAVPRDLLAIVAKAMARDPAARYPSARELAADLSLFLTGQLVGAREYDRVTLLLRWLRRHLLLTSVVLAALVVVVVVAGVSFRRVRRERSFAEQAAAREKARADAMILTQAETVQYGDPTRALAWLKTYPENGSDWTRVRAIARAARERGPARHVFRPPGNFSPIMSWDGGRQLLVIDGRRTMYVLDVATGARRVVCLPAGLSDQWRIDETFGRELATLLVDGRVLVWNQGLDAAEEVALVPGAQAASLSSDGKWLVVARADGLVLLVDRHSGAESLLGDDVVSVDEVQFVPGTSRVLLSGSGAARLYDVEEQRVIYAASPGVSKAWVSQQGRYLALKRRAGFEWLDAVTLESHGVAAGQLAIIGPVAFLPDGRVVYAERGHGVQLWEPRSGQVESLTSAPAWSLSVSPGGRQVAYFDDRSDLMVLDLETHRSRAFLGMAHFGRATTFLGEQLVTAEIEASDIRLWDLSSLPAQVVPLGAQGFEPTFALVDDGRTLIAGAQDGRLVRVRLPGGEPEVVTRIKGVATALAATPDGATLLVIDDRGDMYRIAHGRSDQRFAGVGRMDQLELTRDGRFAVGVSFHTGEVRAWDLERRTARDLGDQLVDCGEIFLSADQRTVALGCLSSPAAGIPLFDLERGTTRYLPAPVNARVHGFSPSGKYLFGGDLHGNVLRWQIKSGEISVRQVHSANAQSGRPISDDVVVSDGKDGVKLTLFSLGTSVVVDASPGLHNLMLSPDRGLVVGHDPSQQELLQIWDLVSHERWSALRLSGHRTGIAYDHSLVVPSLDGALYIFAPPALQGGAPAATRAWLDEVTSYHLDDELEPVATCD